MKKLFILVFILIVATGQSFAYYTVEQIKYEQSLGKTDTQRSAMENPQLYEKMYQDYYNKQNYQNRDVCNNSTYTKEKPLYRFGNSNSLYY